MNGDIGDRRAVARREVTSDPVRLRGPFHLALRAVIEESGLTLEGIRRRLARKGIRVSLTSLSYWQQGRSRPERADSLRAVRGMEHILGLPANSLMALLGPPRPRGRQSPGSTTVPRYDGLLDTAPALTQTMEPLLGESDRHLRVFCQQDRVAVGACRAIGSVHSDIVVQALADGPDRFLAVYSGEPGSQAGDLEPVAGDNCRLGRVRRHHHLPVLAMELLFDQRLRAGDTHLFGYSVRINSSVQSTDYRRGFRYPAGTYVQAVWFAADAVPVRCYGYVQDGTHAGPTVDEELLPSPGRCVHRAAPNVQPGVVGVRWEWE